MWDKLSLKVKFNSAVLIGLLIIITVGLFTVSQIITQEISTQEAQSELNTGYQLLEQRYPGPWRLQDNNLYKGGTLINGNQEIINYLEQFMNGTVTIFAEDTRIATNVEEEDGSLALGTTVSDEVAQQVLNEGEDYYGEATVVGNNYYTAYTPIQNESGEIIGMFYAGAPEGLVNDVVYTIFLWVSVIMLVLIAIILFSLSIFMNKTIFTPLDKVIQTTGEIAEGNLKTNLELNRKDEFGQLEKTINTMVGGLRGMVTSIRQTAESTSSASEQLSASSQQSTASIEEISASSQEFNKTVEGVNKTTTDMASLTEAVNKLTNEGVNQIQATQQQMQNILEASQQSQQVIDELDTASQKIKNIVGVISDIAEETNLLALNASIEAARANNSSGQNKGQGFAVVAEEIRELAEETQNSIGNITEIIEEVTASTEKAVTIIEENNSQIKTGVKKVDESKNYFNTIAEKIEQVNDYVQEVADSGEKLAAGSQEIASATEEQSSAMQQIASSTQELNQMAEELNGLVQQFDI